MSEDTKAPGGVDFGVSVVRGLAAAAREQDRRAGAEQVLEARDGEVRALLRETLALDAQAHDADCKARDLRSQARVREAQHEAARAIYEKLRARHQAQGRGR